MRRASTLWRYTARELRRRPRRALLAVAGTAVGVAAFLAITTCQAVSRDSYNRMFQTAAGRAALEVVAAGLGPFRPDWPRLETVPGVRAAVPVVQAASALLGPGKSASLLVLGIDPDLDAAARDYPLLVGEPISDRPGVLLEARFAARHRLALGDKVRLSTPRGPAEIPIVGLLRPDGPATFNGGAVAILPLTVVRQWFAADGEVNSVQLVLDPAADPETVGRAVAAVLPEGLTVQVPARRGAFGRELLATMDQMLMALSLMSLVLGAFVILNVFQITLGERRRQLALLRAVGATRRQVTTLLMREAVVLGAVGTVLGIGLGLALTAGLLRLYEYMLSMRLPLLRVSPGLLAVAAVLGPAMAALASWRAANWAARRPLLGSLVARPAPLADPPRHPTAWVGVGLVALAPLFSYACALGWIGADLGNALIPPLAAVCAAGCVLALPLVLGPLLGVTQALCSPVLGPVGRLAFRQLQRQPTRTSLTAGILTVGLLITVAFGTAFFNSTADIGRWYDATIRSDFLVRVVPADPSAVITPTDLPGGLAQTVAGLPGAGDVRRTRFVNATIDGRDALLIARAFPAGGDLRLALTHGDADDARRRLAEGEVVLGTALAHRLGKWVGDEVTVATRSGPRNVRVAAVCKEHAAGGAVFYADWDTGRRWFGFESPNVLEVSAASGRYDELESALDELCAREGLVLEHNADFRAYLDRVVRSLEVILGGLGAVVFLVVALAMLNTLTTNVLEQTRELAVLRALGLRRREVGRLIVCEAVVLAAISFVPGVLAGVGLAYLMNVATPSLQGHLVPFAVDPIIVTACVGAALGVAVLSALPAARRAGRLPILDALRYE